MNSKEQIALELTKLYIEKCSCISEERVVEIYQNFFNKINGKEEKDIEADELQIKLGDLDYKLQLIEKLLEKDKNNFVLKEDLYEILGGNND